MELDAEQKVRNSVFTQAAEMRRRSGGVLPCVVPAARCTQPAAHSPQLSAAQLVSFRLVSLQTAAAIKIYLQTISYQDIIEYFRTREVLLLFSRSFPMLVPSLSWQRFGSIRFCSVLLDSQGGF